jgi:hypothetical protein
VQGVNQGSRFDLFTDVAFTRDRQYLFGSIVADGGASRITFSGGVPIRTDWRATAVSDGACTITCVTTGFWELDRGPVLVPEPGGLLLILTGLLGVGLLTSRGPRSFMRCPWYSPHPSERSRPPASLWWALAKPRPVRDP